ncbi:hypothetical protein DAMA08_041320 [Martiniozyma asiatica (nom. inval.)]|nr:hypothetical protein DAMA08_041320 [Martiniozyma asiatica]
MSQTLENFPIELLIQILSYVDSLTLRIAPLVCKTWYKILNDDAVWRAIFQLRYPESRNNFPSISRSDKYRNELFIREKLIQKYHKSPMTSQGFYLHPNLGDAQLLIDGAPVPAPLRNNTLPVRSDNNILVDWTRNKITVLDIPMDTILNCNLRNGKKNSAVMDFVPEGVTCYDWGKNIKLIIFGRWDGSVYGGLVDHKGLVLAKVRNWGKMNVDNFGSGRVSSVSVVEMEIPNVEFNSLQNRRGSIFNNKSYLTPKGSITNNATNFSLNKGQIGAFSGDERGNVAGWDIKEGEILWKTHIQRGRVVKLLSDGKSALIAIMEDGSMWIFENLFDKKKRDDDDVVKRIFGMINMDSNPIFDKRIVVDYGSGSVVIWNDHELLIYNYKEKLLDESLYIQEKIADINITHDDPHSFHEHQHLDARRYTPPAETIISNITLEDNGKRFTQFSPHIIGGDPLMCAITLTNGIIEIINVRESEWTIPVVRSIIPHFLGEHDGSRVQVVIVDDRVSKVASVVLNSAVILVSNHLGKIEVWDVMTGAYLRTALDKLSNSKLTQLEHFIREQGSNVIKINEREKRGVLVIGPYVEYFCFGEDEFITEDDKKFRGRGKVKGGKASSDLVKRKLDDFNFEKQLDEQFEQERVRRIGEFNGEPIINDDDEEMAMALAMSMSIKESTSQVDLTGDQNELDENEQIRIALEMSANEIDHLKHSVGDSMDDDLRLALELSKRENYATWNYEEESQWQPLR